MPKNIKINVEGHRFLDNGKVCEDVTSVVLPSLEHPTTAIENVSGMAMDLEVPNTSRYKAAEYSVAHNNGNNCQYLTNPNKHTIEFRLARQRYNVKKGLLEHEGVKYRITGVHKSTEHGTVEAGNPLGSTERFTVLRFERIVNGETDTIVDVMSGVLKFNGHDLVSEVPALLN
jgi:phage tail tube protein FII